MGTPQKCRYRKHLAPNRLFTDDIIFGYEGDDRIRGRGGHDILDAGEGNDTVYGGSGNDTLLGREGNDELDGGNGNDSIWGESGNNTLEGGHGNDYLNGGSGHDRLLGVASRNAIEIDTLTGGSGNDDFLVGDFHSNYYNNAGNADYALITDFSNGDQVVLDNGSYSLQASPILGINGTAVFEGGELLAILEGVSSHSLTFRSQGFTTSLEYFGLAPSGLTGNVATVQPQNLEQLANLV